MGKILYTLYFFLNTCAIRRKVRQVVTRENYDVTKVLENGDRKQAHVHKEFFLIFNLTYMSDCLHISASTKNE